MWVRFLPGLLRFNYEKKTFLQWVVSGQKKIKIEDIPELMKLLRESKEEFYGEVKIC